MKKKKTVSVLIILFALLIIPPAGYGQSMTEIDKINIISNYYAEIDASEIINGYVRVRYLEKTDKELRVIIDGPGKAPYIYRLRPDCKYDIFPMSDGDGYYRVTVYENITGNKYSSALDTVLNVRLYDEFAPFLRPNQYVNYSNSGKTSKTAAYLTKDSKNTIGKIAAIYNYIIKNISYDNRLAATVQSGYLPDVDEVLGRKKGVCFDYAVLMTAMLRSQGVPAKLVVGYRGKDYHAWVNVYSGEAGWVNGTIYFDGKQWELMDPTLASCTGSGDIIKYIGDGNSYSAKYYY